MQGPGLGGPGGRREWPGQRSCSGSRWAEACPCAPSPQRPCRESSAGMVGLEAAWGGVLVRSRCSHPALGWRGSGSQTLFCSWGLVAAPVYLTRLRPRGAPHGLRATSFQRFDITALAGHAPLPSESAVSLLTVVLWRMCFLLWYLLRSFLCVLF